MLYAQFAKISQEAAKDTRFMNEVVPRLIRPKRKKGLKFLFTGEIMFAHDGLDFAKNRITVRALYNVYKKPRIIKR